jgi:hypothetical protein
MPLAFLMASSSSAAAAAIAGSTASHATSGSTYSTHNATACSTVGHASGFINTQSGGSVAADASVQVRSTAPAAAAAVAAAWDGDAPPTAASTLASLRAANSFTQSFVEQQAAEAAAVRAEWKRQQGVLLAEQRRYLQLQNAVMAAEASRQTLQDEVATLDRQTATIHQTNESMEVRAICGRHADGRVAGSLLCCVAHTNVLRPPLSPTRMRARGANAGHAADAQRGGGGGGGGCRGCPHTPRGTGVADVGCRARR